MSHETLTKFQRQLLINQFAILEKLDTDNARLYQKNQKILESGFALWYDEILPDDEVSRERCDYVNDVLNMFRSLDRSFAALTDKSGIDEEEIWFGGFDGNNESDLLGFAEFIQSEGRFQESLKGDDLNSHSMTERHHNKMLSRFNAICERHDQKWVGNLSRDEIQEIIAIP